MAKTPIMIPCPICNAKAKAGIPWHERVIAKGKRVLVVGIGAGIEVSA